MRSSAERAPSPTHSLKGLSLSDLIDALTSLFPAGRHAALDLRGHTAPLDVFITFERRAGKRVPCSLRVVIGQASFVLDDGADEFARVRLAGAPTFDPNGNVQISAVRRTVDGQRRGSSLWLAHDLSMIAVDDEVCYLR
jgi:hypothetical protein